MICNDKDIRKKGGKGDLNKWGFYRSQNLEDHPTLCYNKILVGKSPKMAYPIVGYNYGNYG